MERQYIDFFVLKVSGCTTFWGLLRSEVVTAQHKDKERDPIQQLKWMNVIKRSCHERGGGCIVYQMHFPQLEFSNTDCHEQVLGPGYMGPG